MIILNRLKATAAEGTWTEPRGSLQAIHDEPVKGFFRQVTLGAGGLLVKRGDAVVGIPMDELLRLAELADPRLQPPKP